METNIFRVEMGEIGHSPSFGALAFLNRVEYRNSDFKIFKCDDLATFCKNLVNCRSVTPEFKRVKGVHPLSISSLATLRHC